MEISMETIQQREDPYQLFLDSFKVAETKRKYTGFLTKFLQLIPDQIYEKNLGKTPNCQQVGTLASCFVELARKDQTLATNIIAAYIKEDIKLVKEDKLNPNTIPNHVKPIKSLLDSNSIPIHWKSLYKLYLTEKKSEDRAYTREEIQRMLDVATDIIDKVIILAFSSSGIRVGAWDYLSWKDVIFFKNNDGSYKGAALHVYCGEPENYYTFITPEACQMLDVYRETWKSESGKYPLRDDPLIKATKFQKTRRLHHRGINLKNRIKL